MNKKITKFIDRFEYSLNTVHWLSPMSVIDHFGWLFGIPNHGPANQFIWRVRNFLMGKHYHKVVIKAKDFPKYTWVDRDHVLLYAAFQVLVDYMEKEKPFDHIAMEGWHYENDYKELLALYNWWTKERPLREEKVNDESYEAEDDKNLIRLVTLRKHLWT